jgi:hypothetical protein
MVLSMERFLACRKRFERITGIEELAERRMTAAKETARAMKKVTRRLNRNPEH